MLEVFGQHVARELVRVSHDDRLPTADADHQGIARWAHTPKVCQLVETEMILAPQSGCNRELGVQEVACTSDPT